MQHHRHKRLPFSIGLVLALTISTATIANGQSLRSPTRDNAHIAQRHVWSWTELKQASVVMQRREYSCGAAALATVVKYYWGDEATEEQFLKMVDKVLKPDEVRDRIENGLTMTDLRRAAVKAGYQASMGKLSFEKLGEVKVPVIVGLKTESFRHFVVVRGMDDLYVYLADPIRGNIRLPAATFVEQWQENAVLAIAKPNTKLKELSSLFVSEGESRLGDLNGQTIRQQALRP